MSATNKTWQSLRGKNSKVTATAQLILTTTKLFVLVEIG